MAYGRPGGTRSVTELPCDTDILCVPAHPVREGDRWGVNLELRVVSGRGKVGIAFTSPDALVSTLGEHQPWIALPAIGFSRLAQLHGARSICIDPVMDAGTPRWTAANVHAVTAMVNR
ncbi:SAV_915 family protein [Streptantibioticus parmotrematis]|uniref:SAV_915 family protein n=1 Tax=Streptantibioticus parmotrematis TaxID=2873249 RepID=UPI00355870B4